MHTPIDTDGKRHAQRHAFALVSQLEHRFHRRGITESDFWKSVKSDYGVQSRSEIDEVGYVHLAARLHTAKRHRHMFDALCADIKSRNNKTGFVKCRRVCLKPLLENLQ